jgi:chromosome segregation ATPase
METVEKVEPVDNTNVKDQLRQELEQEYNNKLQETVKGIQAKNAELLAEKQQWKRERDDAEKLAQERAEEKAKAENNYKQLFESQKQESDNLKSKLTEFQENIKRQKVQSEASKLASSLTKDVSKAKILEQQFSQRLQIVDGELRIVDDRGQLTVQTLNDLTQSVKESYPFLIDGSQATGGSATRSQSRADVSMKEITRSDFDALNQYDRAKYLREGGKITNN